MRWSAVLMLWFALPAGASDTALPDYLPSGTKAVFGIRMRNVIDLLGSQSFSAEWHKASSQLAAGTPLAGFDPLKDLDEVLIATTGEGENPPVLMVLLGRFDVERFTSGAVSYHGVPILEDGKKSGAMAILDASTAIAGDALVVHAAIDRRGSGAGIGSELAARIEPLRSKYSIWGIGSRPEHPAAKAAEPNAMDSVDQFEIGADLAHGLELTAKVHVRSPEDAEKLTSAVALAQTMLKSSQSSLSGTKVEMHTEEGWLTLSLAIPQEALNRAIQEQREAIQAAVMSRLPVAITPPAAPQPPKKPAAPPARKVVANPTADTQVIMLPGAKH